MYDDEADYSMNFQYEVVDEQWFKHIQQQQHIVEQKQNQQV
jgi:hypothetical protein